MLFKFVTPALGFSLDRTGEMVLGVTFPVLVLLLFEISYALKGRCADRYAAYEAWEREKARERCEESGADTSSSDNAFSRRVIGLGIAVSGLIIVVLGIAASSGRVLIAAVGAQLVLLGAGIRRNFQWKHKNTMR